MNGLPSFSVIVPTWNRPKALADVLGALALLDYPRDRVEVIVVDDGGTEDLLPLIERFSAQMALRCLRQANGGPGAARNTGATAARHDYLAFTDDDCRPHPGWLRACATALAGHPGALVGGLRVNAWPDNLCCVASQLILDVAHAHFNREPGRASFFPSDNMAMSRQHFLALGGFDPSFRCAEDRDLCDRWAARGWPLVHAPEARVDHARTMGVWGFLRQHFGYGRGAWRFQQARVRRGAGAVAVDGRFYLGCFGRPWTTEPAWRALRLTGLLGLWQVSNAAGYFYERVHQR